MWLLPCERSLFSACLHILSDKNHVSKMSEFVVLFPQLKMLTALN